MLIFLHFKYNYYLELLQIERLMKIIVAVKKKLLTFASWI